MAEEIWNSIIDYLEPHSELIKLLLIIIVAFIILNLILRVIKSHLLKKVRSKRQVSNVTVFLDLLKYVFALFFLLIIIFAYYNSWGELGFVAGLLTIALGWALQKPISGIFGWLIVLTRRPFRVGDRVKIMGMLGDINDITLTHIMLDEVGGTIEGEESSGRTIMIPTSIIFEQEVINYTERDEYILDEVGALITYESNLEKAEAIMKNSVKKVLPSYWIDFPKKISKTSHIRLDFKDSGISIVVRYNTVTKNRNKIATDIRREIHKQIIATKDVDFAYPHTQVLMNKK